MYDSIIRIGSNYSKNKTKYKYREILYFEGDSDEEYHLVTNIFKLSTHRIILFIFIELFNHNININININIKL